jgi:hypothetical protein
MLSFTKIRGAFYQTTSGTSSHRRRSRTRPGLEALEGRDLMSTVGPPIGPPVRAPQPGGSVPPVIINQHRVFFSSNG